MDLRAHTEVDVLIGPFIDKTDGNTTEDGLSLPQAEIKLSKNGQPLAQKDDGTTAAFDDDGYYNCELSEDDTDTEGQLVLIVHQSANALPVRHEYNVLSKAAYDSLYVAKDAGFLDVNIKTIGRADTQETEASNLEIACSAYSATRGLTGTALPAAAADTAGGIPISAAGALNIDAMNTNVSDIETIVDALGATAAARLKLSGEQILPATVDTVTNTHTPTTTEFQADDITEATSDHYNGRTVLFTSGVLSGQMTDITSYLAVGGIGQFTVTALTEAPANNDTFIIV